MTLRRTITTAGTAAAVAAVLVSPSAMAAGPTDTRQSPS